MIKHYEVDGHMHASFNQIFKKSFLAGHIHKCRYFVYAYKIFYRHISHVNQVLRTTNSQWQSHM